MARKIRAQQTLNTIHKIRNPRTSELLREPEDIERAFEDYYRTLYAQPTAAEEESVKAFLEGLDLPSIGEEQNRLLNSDITEKEMLQLVE